MCPMVISAKERNKKKSRMMWCPREGKAITEKVVMDSQKCPNICRVWGKVQMKVFMSNVQIFDSL